jgi:hypothetical protein
MRLLPKLNRGFIPKYREFTYGDEIWRGLSEADRRRVPVDKTWYILDEQIVWYDKKLDKRITVPVGYISDGASGAIDIRSKGWWVHDWLCDGHGFDKDYNGGGECSNWHASRILSGILWSEKRPVRSWRWRWATFFFGGKGLNRF